MRKSKLNGWHGVAAGCVITGLVLAGSYVGSLMFPFTKANAANNSAFTAQKIGETTNSDMERFYDREAGVVCYIIDGYRAMDCVPDKDTNVSWRTSP